MALADQSLIRAEEADGEPRFRMLDTIREFAAERLDERGERPEIERRHSATFLALVERLRDQLSGDNQRAALSRIERDHDNIRAVLDRAVATADGETAIRVGFAMWRYWQKRGHLAEARRRLDTIAAQPWSRSDPVLRARLMEALGGVAWWQADIAAMKPAYEEALAIWESIGDQAEIANALYNNSFAYAVSENPALSDPDGSAGRQMERARDIYQSIGDERGYANVVWGMGNYEYFQSRFRDRPNQGIPMFRETLEIFRRLGDRTMEAWSLHMLGGGLLRNKEFAEARMHLAEALRLFHTAGDVAGITLVLDDFASAALGEDDPKRAARLWGAARALSSAGGVGLADFVDTQYEWYSRPNARSAIDPAELERYGEEGRAMTLDESVAYALDTTVDAIAPHDHAGAAR
jgi:hypothetical protein